MITAALLVGAAFASATPLAADSRPSPAPASAAASAARLRFHPHLLAGFGLELEAGRGVDRFEVELAAAEPAGFTVLARGADFEGIAGGAIRFASRRPGGFALRARGGRVEVHGVVVRPGARPRTLALEDAHGEPLFRGERIHFDYDEEAGRLRLSEVDLVVAPELAARLGEPRLAGIVLGRLELDAAATPAPAPSAVGAPALDCANPVWDAAIDVRLSSLFAVQQVARADGRVAISLATELENAGAADVPWRRKFSAPAPPFDNDQHPYLVWALYRISGTPAVFEQLGRSALKHAFFATNTGCACAGGQILWAPLGGDDHDVVPCADTYGTGNNDDPNALGPRDELEARTGAWTSRGSFFDADADGVCDWDREGGPDTNGEDCDELTFSGPFDRRLAVEESALAVAGATWYVDAWYVVRDETTIFDDMGWRRVEPECGESGCFFDLATELAAGSPLDAWVPRDSPPPGASHERIDTGAGRLSLAARAMDLGGGWYRYDYALANHDLDTRVRSIRVPLPPGTSVANAGFANGEDGAWSFSEVAGGILFAAAEPAPAAALDWGWAASFRFDADAPPGAGSVDLGVLEGDPSLLLAAPATTPGGTLGAAIFADGFETGAGRWIGAGL